MNFNDIEQSIDKLETNLIAEINELRANTEIVLKELTLYLNVSANDIGQIKEDNIEVKTSMSKIFKALEELDDISKKINIIPEQFKELQNEFSKAKENADFQNKKFHNSNISNLKTIYKYTKTENDNIKETLKSHSSKIDQLSIEVQSIVDALKDYKEEINRGQENLVQVINTIITSSGEKIKSENSLKTIEIKENTKKIQSKNNLWMKIVGGIFGGSGILWFIVQIIINSNGAK
jgi:conjugal transfer/entry exclusion protein